MVRTLLMLTLLAAGCAPAICEQGSMLDGDEGLVVTEAEHPEGWEHPECFACHAAASLHRAGCTPDVDYEALQEFVDATGEDGCIDCHGDNGVDS